jgi:hypothetical protein
MALSSFVIAEPLGNVATCLYINHLPGGDVDGVAGLALRRFLLPTLLPTPVRTVPVAAPGRVVEALAPQRAHGPLCGIAELDP